MAPAGLTLKLSASSIAGEPSAVTVVLFASPMEPADLRRGVPVRRL
jgi:hypothetical protein